MTTSFVDIAKITKLFSKELKPALENVSATIPQGKIVGLVGPDGSGKTTLIRLMAALLLPTEGTITIAGKDTVKEAEEIHELTGYMPQKFGLYEDLTVMQNLELYAELRGIPVEEQPKTFEKLLTFTALKPFTERLAGDLSGGMKQKLGLACALMKKLTLLLLDEPSVGVDPFSRRELWKMVSEQLEEGMSAVWSTAYLDEAERCNTVLLINEGKLLFYGNPHDLTAKMEGKVFKVSGIGNKRAMLAQIMKQENVLDGVIQGEDVRVVVNESKTPPFEIDEGIITKIAPRFEDAFIEILGGGPKGESQLAKMTPQISVGDGNVIIADHLTKKFGSFVAADQVTFTVNSGEVFGLLGPNGAGKSTTFKMLCGLLKPTSGNASVAGLDLQKASSQARAQIGYMAQKFSLHSNLSVVQNLRFFSGIYNLHGEAQEKVIQEMIEIFHLQPYLDTDAGLLPLGYKQRLSLACATMHHPPVLFLDEPTSGVDPQTRREFWNHINGLVQKGVTIMVTTHFMDEAEYCDRIALIYQGKVIKISTPDGLKTMAQTKENPNPTLEDAFIELIEQYDAAKT